jgi:hypothetical protein
MGGKNPRHDADITSQGPGSMAIEIAVKIATFFYIIDNRVVKSKLIAPLFY